MENSGTEQATVFVRTRFFTRTGTHFARKRYGYQQDLARFWQALHDRDINRGSHLRRPDGSSAAPVRRPQPDCPKISRKARILRQKRHNRRAAARDKHLSSGIVVDFDDNGLTESWRFGRSICTAHARFRLEM
jgi:hypothetical protein